MDPVLRLATLDEANEIDELMKVSTRGLFPSTYDDRQTRAAVRYIASVDRQLLEDGTYFVAELDGELVACGGWSRRDKLYTGSGEGAEDARLLDPASEPARIRAMFTRPDWTRRGLGRKILEACESRQSRGLQPAGVDVDDARSCVVRGVWLPRRRARRHSDAGRHEHRRRRHGKDADLKRSPGCTVSLP
jgi:GNAT superfamily N-acetyltransferase